MFCVVAAGLARAMRLSEPLTARWSWCRGGTYGRNRGPMKACGDPKSARDATHPGLRAKAANRPVLRLLRYGKRGVRLELRRLLVRLRRALWLRVLVGWGAPRGLAERVAALFSGVEAVLFEHSHQPYQETKGGLLLFNPGSPTDRVYAAYNSYGSVEVTADGIEARVVRV